MKKIAIILTLAAFILAPSVMAGEAKGSDQKKPACTEKCKADCDKCDKKDSCPMAKENKGKCPMSEKAKQCPMGEKGKQCPMSEKGKQCPSAKEGKDKKAPQT